MTTNTMISVQSINTTLPTFVDDRLNKATQRIISIYADAAKYADTKNRELAKIFSDVSEKKSYEKDGFKSVADYANTIFGIKRQNAYALAAAGKIYNDPQSPDELKSMSPSKLAEISSLNRDKVVKAIADGAISKDMTQKDLREFANKVRNEAKDTIAVDKPRNNPKYTVNILSAAHKNLKDLDLPRTEKEWDDYFLDMYVCNMKNPEGFNLECISIIPTRDDNGKISKRRKVYITSDDSFVVELTRVDDSRNNEPSDSTDDT